MVGGGGWLHGGWWESGSNGGGIENKADELIVLNTDNILRPGMSANTNMLQIDCEEVNRIACPGLLQIKYAKIEPLVSSHVA